MSISLINGIITATAGTISLDALWNASINNGWGLIEKIGTRLYVSYAPIHITGTASFFQAGAPTHAILYFEYSTATNNHCFRFEGSTGTCRIGNYPNPPAVYTGSNSFVINAAAVPSNLRRVLFRGDCIVANTTLTHIEYAYLLGTATEKAIGVNLNLQRCQFALNTNDFTELINYNHSGGFYGWWCDGIDNYEGGLISNCNVGIIVNIAGGVAKQMKNVRFRDIRREVDYTYMRTGNSNLDKEINIIDCGVPKTGLGFYLSGNNVPLQRNTQRLQSTTEINVFDENKNVLEGAVVSIYDKDGGLLFEETSDSEGKIETILTFFERIWNVQRGQFISEEIYDYEPFKIKVSKDGYETYFLQNTTVQIGEKTIIRAQLKPQVSLLIPVNGGSPMLKINPENHGPDRDLGVLLLNNPDTNPNP